MCCYPAFHLPCCALFFFLGHLVLPCCALNFFFYLLNFVRLVFFFLRNYLGVPDFLSGPLSLLLLFFFSLPLSFLAFNFFFFFFFSLPLPSFLVFPLSCFSLTLLFTNFFFRLLTILLSIFFRTHLLCSALIYFSRPSAVPFILLFT